MALGILGGLMPVGGLGLYVFWKGYIYKTFNLYGYYPTPDLGYCFFGACGAAGILLFGMVPGIKKVNNIETIVEKQNLS